MGLELGGTNWVVFEADGGKAVVDKQSAVPGTMCTPAPPPVGGARLMAWETWKIMMLVVVVVVVE